MFLVYNSLLLLAALIFAPLPVLLTLLKSSHRQRFIERCALAYTDSLSGFSTRPIWIHAVSVGEVMASVQLIRELKHRFPDRPAVLSTTTATGNATARAHAKAADAIIYFPYDLPSIVKCTVRCIQPALFLAIETEIWPNLYRVLHKQGVPMLIVSGRISEKSFPRYCAFSFFFGRVLAMVNRFCMQSALDAERIKEIGAPEGRVSVCGNIKFDLSVPDVSPGEQQEMRSLFGLGPQQPLLIAGSTHRGEEQQVLETFIELRKESPDLVLLLAPRHPVRFDEAAATIAASGLACVRRTALTNGATRTDEPVILLDTIGELIRVYSIGTVIVIGGSLVKGIGGHNPLEPAAAGKPVVFGPQMANFKEIARILTSQQAAFQVPDKAVLADTLRALLNSPEMCAATGAKALAVIRENSGAAVRIADTIQAVMQQNSSSTLLLKY
jgi:3-deoxy-D-manno-octulosonic-acid transferase